MELSVAQRGRGVERERGRGIDEEDEEDEEEAGKHISLNSATSFTGLTAEQVLKGEKKIHRGAN